ncbi:MAG: helix-turn-helix transcriptional regulator [Salinibacterium sp.]|nr:helix-turn-helix transcriptional regulator [Salinibacterium sp.]
MAMPVLATKLFVPPPRPQAVQRSRLTAKLDDGVRIGRKLTLISAPAGFGKTTLLSEWIAATARRDPEMRIAWLSLEESDNDPVRFLTYLIAALNHAEPSVGSGDRDPQLPAEAVLTTLINELTLSSHSVLLVLDDFQLIEDATVRDAVAFLLDHLPSRLHVAIASRSDPLLPVSRIRARGELTELRAADLRFTPDEASDFLTTAMGLTLTREDVAMLETRTEGWIAGLQLAALSMRERSDLPGFISAFAGSNRFVIDYLIEEVLERAPLDVREFLCQTAILDRLSGPLCNAVTGQTDSAEVLESLERANLFVVPLDDHREWYRYHHLFADVLKIRLLPHGSDHISALHGRASEWYESHGLSEDAVHHAFEAADFSRAARVIEATIPGVRKSRQDSTLLGWLDRLPPETINRRPVLTVFSAWSSLVHGAVGSVEPKLAHAEQLLAAFGDDGMPAHDSEPSDELASLPVTIELYRAAVAMASGDQAGIKTHAQRGLDIAAPDDHLGRGAAAGLLGLASWASGELSAGVAAFEASSASLRRAGNLTDALSTTLVISDMLMPLGRLGDTQAAFESALAESFEHHSSGQPTADLHAGLAEVLRERNELFAATEQLAASDALGEGAFSHEHRYRWFVAMAGVRQAEGRLDAAFDLLTQAEQHYRRGFFPESRPIWARKARIRILQERLTEAMGSVSELGLTGTDELSYLTEFGHITLARVLLAQHRAEPVDPSPVTALLARLLDSARAGGRNGSALEIFILQSLALEAQGQTALALIPLEHALDLAAPEGFVRVFLDEGAPMLRLLRAAAGAGIRPDYVRQLNQALRETAGADVSAQPASEVLSERELHVLRLLATSMTGPEIARELYVSLNTMRTHTKHIFLKLDVTSRAAAVHRAEVLGLI